MNIHLENVNLQSTSGPNHFASKLVKYLDATFDYNKNPDVRLCFIETHQTKFNNVPLVQRLDGIYFNKEQDFLSYNENIKRTYDNASGVIFQSEFNKKLITRYFGDPKKYTVVHNGADIDHINSIKPFETDRLDFFNKVWCCASSWRPHKRLNENIRYFLEQAPKNDCLLVAGPLSEKFVEEPRIFYVGVLKINQLISLYKRADYFVHLAWLDHCPNVVVDARAAGCHIICSSTGGTPEIAGPNATLIHEEEWDFEPVQLYKPPKMDFSRKTANINDIGHDMHNVSIKYKKFIEGFIK